METSFHNVDPSHQLRLEIHMHGFKPAILDFPRTELFCKIAKFGGAKFSLSEVVAFVRDSTNGISSIVEFFLPSNLMLGRVIDGIGVFVLGPMYVTVEKVMDAFSGARELFISVPFLLYNCTGFPLFISESASDMKGVSCIVPSCYDMAEQEVLQGKKDGLGLLSSSHDLNARDSHTMGSSSSRIHIVSIRENATPHREINFSKPLYSEDNFHELLSKCDLDCPNSLFNSLRNRSSSSSQLTSKDFNSSGYECGRVKGCMFSPNPFSSAGEVMVRVSRCMPEHVTEKMPNSLLSSPFSLIPPSGSTTVLVPQLSSNAAFLMSVTSSAVAAPFAGRTSAITFQPR